MAINETPSRLSTQSENLREKLLIRNLFSPLSEYPSNQSNTADNVVSAINSVIEGIAPFNSYDLKNTVYGRLVTSPSPLTEIGLVMLGKQFGNNFMSNLSQQTLPVIKVNSLFDGKKDTKLFTKNEDLRITRREGVTNFRNFLDKLVFRTLATPHPSRGYPFTKYPTYSDYIKNTGLAQLDFMYNTTQRNLYRPKDDVFTDYADEKGIELLPVSSVLGSSIGGQTKKYFNFDDINFYPYNRHSSDMSDAVIRANKSMYNSTNSSVLDSIEYAPDYDKVKKLFGKSVITTWTTEWDIDSDNEWINKNSEFSGENDTKFVWGRDGVDFEVNKKNKNFRGDFNDVKISPIVDNEFYDTNPFNIKTGLLEYTRNLISASDGQFGDMTKKVFLKDGKLVGFNGSGLWKANDSDYAKDSKTAKKTGVRQHTVLDPYDKFAKAIRFNGNEVYNGNPDSVIFNNVLPRIHPTKNVNTGRFNEKNLMFSIENLAVRVIKNDGYGIIDDEKGSKIPVCEVGGFNGRLMWFPPYNLKIVETSNAKFEPTVMIGRNEPMYNYMNSERGGTLTFSLIVDYPQHLKSLKYQGVDKQKIISEFFAFGGDNEDFVPVKELELEREKTINDIKAITGEEPSSPEEIDEPNPISFVFPNNVPKTEASVSGIIDVMYKELTYEIIDGFPSSDGTSWGLNSEVYYTAGLRKIENPTSKTKYKFASSFNFNTFSQYTQTGYTGQFGNECRLNYELRRIFKDEKNRPLYSVYVFGSASKLFTEGIEEDLLKGEKYNLELGKRRADAVIELVEERIKAMFGKSARELGIEVAYDPEANVENVSGSYGDTKADKDNATKKAIKEKDTKNERSAIISIKKNGNTLEPIPSDLSIEDQGTVKDLTDKLDKIEGQIRKAKNAGLGADECIMKERGVIEDGDTGILGGFDSISGNYFYPAFHSQTPEDFHKRLTFLQQCTRQGAAVRTTTKEDETGIPRAKNSVFGRQPICILRIGDFFYTKIIIETLTIDYNETTWDLNPEGFGLQPMIADVTLQIKIIGGQSLKGPIDALQNAVSFNYYANSTFTDRGMYSVPSKVAESQASYMEGILTSEQEKLFNEYKEKNK